MICSVLVNDWGGGQQLEDTERDDVLSSLEKSETANSEEMNQSRGRATNTKKKMRREELLLDRGKEEFPSSSDRSKTVISKEKDQTEYAMVESQMADGKAEKITEDIHLACKQKVGYYYNYISIFLLSKKYVPTRKSFKVHSLLQFLCKKLHSRFQNSI